MRSIAPHRRRVMWRRLSSTEVLRLRPRRFPCHLVQFDDKRFQCLLIVKRVVGSKHVFQATLGRLSDTAIVVRERL